MLRRHKPCKTPFTDSHGDKYVTVQGSLHRRPVCSPLPSAATRNADSKGSPVQAVFFPTRCWLLYHSPLAMYQRCNVSDTVWHYYRLIAATSGHCICCQWRRSRPGNVWSFCRRSSPLGRLVVSRDGGAPAVPE